MGQKFNKNIMFDNISFMLKELGKKIGELESEAGVSPGYISRTTKESNTKPGIDFIMNVADALNVSVDTLLRVDMSRLTPTEQYIITFLEKLVKDTLDDKLNWQTETAGYLNRRLETDMNGYCDHPLFSMENFYEQGETEYPDEVTRIVFTSHAYDVHTCIDGDCYNLRMKNGTVLYIMKICKSVYRTGDPDAHAIEIWMCPKRSSNQFLCSTKDTVEIAALIENLYAVVSQNARHPKVKKDIKNVIDAFLNDDMEDDEDQDDIPFI